MKNVLLLSCSTGQGHNSCAQAIKEYFEDKKIQCEIQDSVAFISQVFGGFMSWGHSFMYRHIPGLFRWGYSYSQEHSWVFSENSVFYKILTVGAENLYEYMVYKKFDTVICTHMFSAIIVTYLLNKRRTSIKTAFVATDYTFYPGMEACNLQKYFIASECLVDAYHALGISRERIIASGIPVQKKFRKRTDKEQAKRLLHIDGKNKHLLMMCGSMGCGPMAEMLKETLVKLPEDVEVSVICGTNKYLYRKLRGRYRQHPKVHVTGYTDKMPLYMDSADLCLTKPGGISVTEAAVKKLPMAFINAVAGCEQYNMEFFIRMGAAITADSPAELVQKCIRLLKDEQKRKQMEIALRQYQQTDGAERIFCEMNRGVRICENQ